jgi:hypothetical protein
LYLFLFLKSNIRFIFNLGKNGLIIDGFSPLDKTQIDKGKDSNMDYSIYIDNNTDYNITNNDIIGNIEHDNNINDNRVHVENIRWELSFDSKGVYLSIYLLSISLIFISIIKILC